MYISGLKSLQVEWRELRALNGLDLKVYVLVRNYPGQLTCREIADLLGETRGRVWLSLLRLTDRYYLRHDAQGRYEKVRFFHLPRHWTTIGRPSNGLRKISLTALNGIFGKIDAG